jgi:hypothetical protein
MNSKAVTVLNFFNFMLKKRKILVRHTDQLIKLQMTEFSKKSLPGINKPGGIL